MNTERDICREVQADPRAETWDRAVRAHAAECPTCADFLASYAVLSDRLKALPCAGAGMPEAMREGLLGQLAACPEPEAGSGRRSSWRILSGRALVPVAMAATLVLGILLGRTDTFTPAPPSGEVVRSIGTFIGDVTHDHYLLGRIRRPLEIEATDAGELSDWLSASLNFAFRLPDRSDGLTLEGGRVWHTVGRLSALASYTTPAGQRVVLFAVPAENLTLDGADSEMVRGTRVFRGRGWGQEARAWVAGNLAYAVTAPEGALPDDWDRIFLP